MAEKKKLMLKKKSKPPVQPTVEGLGDFPDFTKKEIFTQHILIQKLLNKYIKGEKICLDFLKLKADKIKRIYFVAQGNDYGCAVSGAYNFEVLVDICSVAITLSEFNHSNPIIDKSTLVIVFGDSRDNEQIAQAVKRVEEGGGRALLILDYDESDKNTISLDHRRLGAFPTVNFTLKYVMCALLALYLGEKNQIITELYVKIAVKMLLSLPDKIHDILKSEYFINSFSEKIGSELILTGCNVDYAVALYGAGILSLGSQICATAIPLGELDLNNLSGKEIALASSRDFYSLIKEYDFLFRLVPSEVDNVIENALTYCETIPLFNPVLSSVILQLLAYDIKKDAVGK